MTAMVYAYSLFVIMVAAWAEPASVHAAPLVQPGTYAVRGNVASRCSTGSSGGVALLEATVDRSGKLPINLNNRSFVLNGLMCSGASQIRVSATALRRNPALASLAPSQTQAVNFTAVASGWSPLRASVTTATASPLGGASIFAGAPQMLTNARAGSITVTVSNFSVVPGRNGQGGKLVDGPYAATITVSLTPAI